MFSPGISSHATVDGCATTQILWTLSGLRGLKQERMN